MKQWHQSLTIRAIMLGIVATLLRYFGVDAAEEDLKAIVDAIGTMITLAFSVAAIIGRVRANKQIGSV
jgi:uncharacterized membrane protein YqjE